MNPQLQGYQAMAVPGRTYTLFIIDPMRGGSVSAEAYSTSTSMAETMMAHAQRNPHVRIIQHYRPLNTFRIYKGKISGPNRFRADRWKDISYARLPKALKAFMLINPEGA